MTQSEILNKAKRIKKDYCLHFSKTIGSFTQPSSIDLREGKLLVANKLGEISVFESESGKLLQQIKTGDEGIRCLAYAPEIDSVLFTKINLPDIFQVPLKGGNVTKFNRKETEFIMNEGGIRLYQGKVYALDTYTHKLLEFNLKGEMTCEMDLGKCFEFPIQFLPLQKSNHFLLTRFSGHFYCREKTVERIKKYKVTTETPKSNIGIFDADKNQIELLPEIEMAPFYSLRGISEHPESGAFFFNDNTNLYKFDSEFKPIFSVDLTKLTASLVDPRGKGLATFWYIYADSKYLYLLESSRFQTVFVFEVASHEF